jgi:signal transduction histidine kinase/ActR/RegA family two-component response regulator
MQLAARTQQEQRDVSLDVEFADGRTLALIVSAAPLFHPDGRVRGAIGTHVDVTGLKQVQRELEEADRQKNEFLAMLAHELRNPLAPIRNATEFLVRAPNVDPQSRNAAVMIQRQVMQLTRLVDDLLDVARITRGQIELKRIPIELAPLVAQALEATEPLMRERRHRVSVKYPVEPIFVNGDAMRLVQCMVNVLNNSAKYTDPLGEIQVELSADNAMALITVRDNGMGVVPEFLPRMFELFTQSQRALDRAQGGLGVGLSLVRKIVEMHLGQVACTSAGVGQGCTCKIWLPLTENRINSAHEARPAGIGARKVMIVDDNHDAADSLAMMLALNGHNTYVAYSAEAAIAGAGIFRPDVILLDIGLPLMDGYEVARKLRARPEYGQVRIVALTGYGQLDERQVHTAEFDAHLVKPVGIDALIVALGAPTPGRDKGH